MSFCYAVFIFYFYICFFSLSSFSYLFLWSFFSLVVFSLLLLFSDRAAVATAAVGASAEDVLVRTGAARSAAVSARVDAGGRGALRLHGMRVRGMGSVDVRARNCRVARAGTSSARLLSASGEGVRTRAHADHRATPAYVHALAALVAAQLPKPLRRATARPRHARVPHVARVDCLVCHACPRRVSHMQSRFVRRRSDVLRLVSRLLLDLSDAAAPHLPRVDGRARRSILHVYRRRRVMACSYSLLAQLCQ